jgi:hypothetical protein
MFVEGAVGSGTSGTSHFFDFSFVGAAGGRRSTPSVNNRRQSGTSRNVVWAVGVFFHKFVVVALPFPVWWWKKFLMWANFALDTAYTVLLISDGDKTGNCHRQTILSGLHRCGQSLHYAEQPPNTGKNRISNTRPLTRQDLLDMLTR